MGRHPDHDYRSKCYYHITLKKLPHVQDFSEIRGTPDSCYPYYSVAGKAIEDVIWGFKSINPDILVEQYIIMPDHVHLLIRVIEYLDEAVGNYIGRFKVKCVQLARYRGVCEDSLFKENFHDRFLRPYHSLNDIYQYIKQNPRRLLVRKVYPEFFQRTNHLFYFEDIHWQAYGNMQLIMNPFKDAVVCHRDDASNPDIEKAKLNNWLHTVSNGGVLVSPFIAGKEKDVRTMAEDVGGKTILLINKPFGERYKPGGHNFELCEQGRLLIIAPYRELPAGRATWLFLNKVAEYISLCRWRDPLLFI